MNKKILPFTVLALFMVLVAVVMLTMFEAPSGPATINGVLECGSDEECFYAAAKDCMPARVVSAGTRETDSQKFTMMMSSEVKGIVDGKCVLYHKIDTFHAENRSDIPVWLRETYDEMEDAFMTCTTSQVTGETECSGPLKRLLDEKKPVGDRSLTMLDSYCENGKGYVIFMNNGESYVRLGDCDVDGSNALCGDLNVTKSAGSAFNPTLSDERISPGEITIFEDNVCGEHGCIYSFTIGGEPAGTAVISC